MTTFKPKGPPRFEHQKRGLRKMLATRGVTALLWDPGTSKTATTLDYASILALKAPRHRVDGVGEARVLVIAPLAAVDTWVIQAEQYVSDQVDLWAEVVGGSIRTRAEALAARGGSPFRGTPERGPRNTWQGPRAAHYQRAIARTIRRGPGNPSPNSPTNGTENGTEPLPGAAESPKQGTGTAEKLEGAENGAESFDRFEPDPSEGPDGVGNVTRNRLILEVTNIDTLKSRVTTGSRTAADVVLEAIRRFQPDLMVLDESHLAKGASSNVSRLLRRISEHVPRRILLTGTVMPHSPLDVWAQWAFLDPYVFGTKMADGSVRKSTFGNFRHRFAVFGGWMGKEITGYQNLDDLQDLMSLNSMVVRKEDALDLPPTTEVVVPVELSPAEKRAYREMADNLAATFGPTPSTGAVTGGAIQPLDQTATATNRLTQMMRMRQITAGHLPDDTGVLREVGHSKIDTIKSLVTSTLAGEKRIVIFGLFVHEIAMLKKTLSGDPGEKHTEVMVIGGGTGTGDRTLIRKRFGVRPEDDPTRMVLIAQIQSMSLAVNELVTASHAIFASLPQQRDQMVQAKARLDRQGQTRPVTFWVTAAPGTVDQVILDAHRDRTNLETAMLTHVQRVHEGAAEL